MEEKEILEVEEIQTTFNEDDLSELVEDGEIENENENEQTSEGE